MSCLIYQKLNPDNMKLQTTPHKYCSGILRQWFYLFHLMLKEKELHCNSIHDVDEIIVYLDKEKFEKIINNILSNAFKFTPRWKD